RARPSAADPAVARRAPPHRLPRGRPRPARHAHPGADPVRKISIVPRGHALGSPPSLPTPTATPTAPATCAAGSPGCWPAGPPARPCRPTPSRPPSGRRGPPPGLDAPGLVPAAVGGLPVGVVGVHTEEMHGRSRVQRIDTARPPVWAPILVAAQQASAAVRA